MSKEKIAAAMRHELTAVTNARRSATADALQHARRIALRRFQANRLALTHADLLAEPDSVMAARFFLDDLYGSHDLTERDANLARIIPTMERLLPETALKMVAEAIALDALSERLDGVMAEALGTQFSDHDYVVAFRSLTSHAERERQITLVELVGKSLCELVRVPMIGMTLRMMGGPARLAQLHELHAFLDRGYRAFKGMRRPEAFVDKIIARERAILGDIYAGSEHPFSSNAFPGDEPS